MSVAARAVKRGDNLKARLDKTLAQLSGLRQIPGVKRLSE